MQVDALRPGLLGGTREIFAKRYCNRRLVAVCSGMESRMKYDNSGLSYAAELHSLLKQVLLKLHCRRAVPGMDSERAIRKSHMQRADMSTPHVSA